MADLGSVGWFSFTFEEFKVGGPMIPVKRIIVEVDSIDSKVDVGSRKG
jgi:hypothetical protein